MKLPCVCLAAAVALFATAGCARKPITKLDRLKAANLVSEAQFAVTVREYPRAESLFQRATALCPDTGEYWISLGSIEMRLRHRSAARDAYRHALRAYEDAADANRASAAPALQQVYVLALLGRVGDARGLLAKLGRRFPRDPDVTDFIQEKRLDVILADPQFKALAL